LSGSYSGSEPICPTLSLISTLPNFVAPNFWKLMPCLEQITLRAGIPQCTCPGLPHSEPRMGSLMTVALILGTCLATLQSLNLCQST
jgi:hypothetical protein